MMLRRHRPGRAKLISGNDQSYFWAAHNRNLTAAKRAQNTKILRSKDTPTGEDGVARHVKVQHSMVEAPASLAGRATLRLTAETLMCSASALRLKFSVSATERNTLSAR